ncbi:MAG: SAM-dependent methyltransferase [Eubacterium sp.]|nr:SAM-dependent methyltransferase [Eubacterium sp.]
MIKLSDRLQCIADRVAQGETVADIGTDHGYLPIYLRQCGKSPRVIMSDISKGSLEKAIEKRRAERVREGCEARLGDGLDVLEPGEADTVVMAGIGGYLTIEILEWDIAKSRTFPKYILQPRKDPGVLRRWLYTHGYTIDREDIVTEGKRYCEILTVSSPGQEGPFSREEDGTPDEAYEFPDSLIEQPCPLTEAYLADRLSAEEAIMARIVTGIGGPEAAETDKGYLLHRKRAARLRELIERLGKETE